MHEIIHMHEMLDHFQRALEWAVAHSESYTKCPLLSLKNHDDKQHAVLTQTMTQDWCQFTQQELGENIESLCKLTRRECTITDCWMVVSLKKTEEG